MISDESSFCIFIRDDCDLVRREPGTHWEPRYLQLSHTRSIPGVMSREQFPTITYYSRPYPNELDSMYVRLVVAPIVLPFFITIPEVIFQQDNARPHTTVITHHAL